MGLRTVLLVLLLGMGPTLAQNLVAPFDVAAIRARSGVAAAVPACPPPPAPMAAPPGTPYYADRGGRSSLTNAELLARNVEEVRPLRDYLRGLTGQANAWVAGLPPDPAPARCALAWLDAWASAGALLAREATTQGGYERKWALGALAMAFLQVRDAPALDPAALARVRGWLVALAGIVRAHYDRPLTDRLTTDVRNNHMTWAGMTVGAAAIAADDRALFGWAMERARLTLEQVTPEGHLPREMGRGGRALHYHLFALAPLSVLVRMADANGVALDMAALDRLRRAAMAGLLDPGPFAAASGVEQAEPRAATVGGYAAAALLMWPGRPPLPALDSGTPLRGDWLGGDVRLLFVTP